MNGFADVLRWLDLFAGWDERIGRRLTLRDLGILLTAVEAGSMSKAAEKLRVSQPAISKTISLLEREVGAQLITRTPRGVGSTAVQAAHAAGARRMRS